MKQRLIAAGIIVALMIVLIATNPSEEAHREAVKRALIERTGVDPATVGRTPAERLMHALANSPNIRRDDYYLFSRYGTDGERLSFGILGMVSVRLPDFIE